MNSWIFDATTRDSMFDRIRRFAEKLPKGKRYKVTLVEYRATRSGSQNRYLWGVVYPTILQSGQLEGWTADDLHEFFLIEHFGSEIIEGFGRKRHKPIKRSSKLSTVEFMDFVAHIQQFMAERGVYIPDPGEDFDAV